MQEPIGKQLADGNKGEKIMTNEQLTQEVLKLAEHQAKCDAERENMLSVIEELREDIKATKSLAEDVHILAVNMENMQKAQDEINKKLSYAAKNPKQVQCPWCKRIGSKNSYARWHFDNCKFKSREE